MQTEIKNSKLEKILDLAKKDGATSVEIIQKSWSENPVSFENNTLKSLESNQNTGISIRLIKNKKIGSSSSTDPDALESLVTAAIEASEFGPEATFEFTKENISVEALHATPLQQELLLENLVERGTNVIESLGTFHKDLLVSGGFNLGFGETVYLNSNGVSGKKKKSIYSTSFSALLVQDEDFLGIYDSNSNLKDFPDEKEISKKILEKLNHSKATLTLETKKYPVIFTPRAVASVFREILEVMLNGKVIQQKVSPLVDKLGKELFDKRFSFIEDPTIGTNATLFDDEGIKTTKKHLIKNGVVNSFYFDLSSASRDVARYVSTGNGFKGSLTQPPSPNLTSLVIDGGKTKYNDLIKNIKEGVLVDQLLGAGQSNTLAGEFNVGIDLGFKIKDGRIQGRVKNCMIAGNIFEILKNISEISKEQEWVSGSMLFPAFLIESMTVAGR